MLFILCLDVTYICGYFWKALSGFQISVTLIMSWSYVIVHGGIEVNLLWEEPTVVIAHANVDLHGAVFILDLCDFKLKRVFVHFLLIDFLANSVCSTLRVTPCAFWHLYIWTTKHASIFYSPATFIFPNIYRIAFLDLFCLSIKYFFLFLLSIILSSCSSPVEVYKDVHRGCELNGRANSQSASAPGPPQAPSWESGFGKNDGRCSVPL